MAESDAALAQVIGRQLQRHLVTRQNANLVFPHFAAGIRHKLMALSSVTRKRESGSTSSTLPCISISSSLANMAPWLSGSDGSARDQALPTCSCSQVRPSAIA